MPMRNASTDDYRYGFNGMEKDDEIKGTGNSLDFGARIYDPRVGRWLSVDPLARKYPSMSSYNFVGNRPILFVDPDGRKWVNIHTREMERLEKKLALGNLTEKEIKDINRAIRYHCNREHLVNEAIEEIKINDPKLYEYINTLSVTKVEEKDGVLTQTYTEVMVNVEVEYNPSKSGETPGETHFEKVLPTKKDYIIYNGKNGIQNTGYPLANEKEGYKFNEIGFVIQLNTYNSFTDNTLANEAGDVMFNMEFPYLAALHRGDDGLSREEYVSKNSPGRYSFYVEYLYKINKEATINGGPRVNSVVPSMEDANNYDFK